MIYRGTSTSLWVAEGVIAVSVVVVVINVAIVLLVAAALIAAGAVIAFLLWWAWLEFRDRILHRTRPPRPNPSRLP